jgi:NAD(P)-dependent dehydrogenase (short-subunit alcohol dehydrogenase family)
MILDSFRLDGRVALVTGGNRGLGQMCALALAEAGADVALLGRTKPSATAAQVKALGQRVAYVSCDLAAAGPAQLADAVAAQLGRLDILVNNAGAIRRAPATDYTAPLREDPVRAASLLEPIPAGRWGAPENLMGPVVFFASAAARYVHGAVLPVDGGWLAR